MKTTYDGTLVLPNNYVSMDEEEMVYVDGGDAHLKMCSAYLRKAICYSIAVGYVANKTIQGMTAQQVAEEIYAHAVAYYRTGSLQLLGLSPLIVNAICSRAKVVDIEDGGDKRTGFMAAYSLIWKVL